MLTLKVPREVGCRSRSTQQSCLRIDHFAVTLPFGFNPKYIHTVEERDRDAPTTKQPDHLAIMMRLSAKL